MADKKDWELRTGADVAEALDWLRRRMKGRGLVLVAVGTDGVAYAVDPAIGGGSARHLLETNLLTVETGIHKMQRAGVTRAASRRADVDDSGAS